MSLEELVRRTIEAELIAVRCMYYIPIERNATNSHTLLELFKQRWSSKGQTILLDRHGISDIPGDFFENWPSSAISSISIAHNKNLTALAPRLFAPMSSLQSLNLEGCGLNELVVGVFDGLTQLNSLNLSGNQLREIPVGLFRDLTSLTSLRLSDNRLFRLYPGSFNGLTSLNRLDLDQNSLKTVPVGVFDGLSCLVRLNMSDNILQHNSYRQIPVGAWRGLTSLNILWLGKNYIRWIDRAFLSGLTGLTYLDLSVNWIERIEAEAFVEMPGLEFLHLGRNRLGHLGDYVFAGLRSLNVIALEKNRMESVSADAFADCVCFQVTLSCNCLTGLPAFPRELGLTRICLENNWLELLSLGVFQESVGLEFISVKNNPVLRALSPDVFANRGRGLSLAYLPDCTRTPVDFLERNQWRDGINRDYSWERRFAAVAAWASVWAL